MRASKITTPYHAYKYACQHGELNIRGEILIAKNKVYSFQYAMNIIKRRFPRAEELLLNSEYRKSYLTLFTASDLMNYLKVSPEEQLIHKLKYTEEELKEHFHNSIEQ